MTRARGYTLVEMIVVVAIVASLAALSLPALRRPLGKSELRAAAKQLANELLRARLAAIESGVAQQFRFQPGKGRFEISPRPVSGGGTSLPFTTVAMAVSPLTADQLAQDEPRVSDLPAHVSFFGQKKAETSPTDLTLTLQPDSSQWSTPIVFHPNGRTTHARIRLSGDRGFFVDVTLRGLTGETAIGRLFREEPSQ